MIEKVIIKGKIGGWRPNSGRKPGFVGYWTGKKRPGAKSEHLKAYHKKGEENVFAKLKYPAEEHPRWKGGTWLYWRKKVLIRDNYTCQICKLYDPEVMQVDHITAKSILKKKGIAVTYDMNNLWTLCANCHARKTSQDRKHGAKSKSYYTI